MASKKDTTVTCEVCGKRCKSVRGLATHMRSHKNDEKKRTNGLAEIVRRLTGGNSGAEENKDLMIQAKEVDVLMETFPLIQSKRSIDRLEKLCEARDRLDETIHEKIKEKSESEFAKTGDLLVFAKYLTEQVESEQASLKNFQTVLKGGVDFNLTTILNQILSVNDLSGGSNMEGFGGLTPGQREQLRRFIEKTNLGDMVDVDATPTS